MQEVSSTWCYLYGVLFTEGASLLGKQACRSIRSVTVFASFLSRTEFPRVSKRPLHASFDLGLECQEGRNVFHPAMTVYLTPPVSHAAYSLRFTRWVFHIRNRYLLSSAAPLYRIVIWNYITIGHEWLYKKQNIFIFGLLAEGCAIFRQIWMTETVSWIGRTSRYSNPKRCGRAVSKSANLSTWT